MRDRKNHIAIIYEGEKTEKTLVEKMQDVFFWDIGILNSIPLFLLEYFDETFWNHVMPV